jgi:N6-adenosine-specific RNA methylase IME4
MKSHIARRKSNLPAKPSELRKWILIGKVKLRAQIAAIKAIKSIEEASVATQAALEDTQDLAEELLYAEAQMGAMLEAIPKSGKDQTSGRGSMVSLPDGIGHKESHYAQKLSKNEGVIATVVAEAREKGEVPVRQHVLRKIKANAPKPKKTPLPKGKYDIIYADPPWEYQNTGVAGAASEQYATMPISELVKMQVGEKIGKDAVLFLWVTNPLLEECFPVISAWGFKYKTNFCWRKMNRTSGVGFYVRGVHELLLICTRGSMLPVQTPLSVIACSAREHSRKPDEVYGIIERMYPQGKYLELFARKAKPRKKWTFWGAEA